MSGIVLAAGELRAADLARDPERLDAYRLLARRLFAEVDALLVPTTTDHPTLAEVAADPVAVNARLGNYTNYTNFANLLELSGFAVPAGEAVGSFFGVTVLAPAFGDEQAGRGRSAVGRGLPERARNRTEPLAAKDQPW